MIVVTRNIFVVLKQILFLSIMIVVWLVLGMVYMDRFIVPFERLKPFLMPWREKGPSTSASVEGFLSVMQNQLDGANRIAHYTLIVMISTFALLCVYLTLVYQEKQRRSRENVLLSLKNQEIARRNEFIRYISATIGHEFKNNLGRIKRRIDLLGNLPRNVKERIDENMDKLFSDIDIFKRISDEREAGLISFERVDLKEMLVGLTRQYDDFADFRFDSTFSLPLIYASQPLLKTVFENLIDNAIKYKKPEQERARIVLLCSEDRDSARRYVRLSFRDEGKGMSEQEADLCFYKGRTSAEGWGQGLYYAKYVIGLHAGKIRVGKEYTEPGTGTEIIINLPFVEESL